MIKPFASRGTFERLLLYRILPLFVLSVWLAACMGQSASLANNVSMQAHSQSWAQVEIAKPTHTAFPTPIPTITPSSVETQPPTPEVGTFYAEIVPDTPTLEYGAEEQFDVPPAPAYGGSKYILVDISEQHLYAYEADTLAFSFVASTGMNNATRVGTFSVLDKIPSAYGATWNIWMPNWLGIYYSGTLENGIHALPILPNGAQLWAGFLGRPISYGCVVLDVYESQLLYDWADIGTPVEIRW